MCLLCIELQKNNIKGIDFVRNFGELVASDPQHAEEVADKYYKKIEELSFDSDENDGYVDWVNIDLDYPFGD